MTADDANGRVLRLEEARHAHDGAGGAHGGHEGRHLALCLRPDLGARGLEVSAPVVVVAELVEHQVAAARDLLAREIDGALHAAVVGREDDFGAKGAHELHALGGGSSRA